MKQVIHDLIAQALQELAQASHLPPDLDDRIQVTPSREASQGNFASNVALVLARTAGMPPRELAALIVARLPPADSIERVEIAGPGFINFFVASGAGQAVVRDILDRTAPTIVAGIDVGETISGFEAMRDALEAWGDEVRRIVDATTPESVKT